VRLVTAALAVLGAAAITGAWWSASTVTAQRAENSVLRDQLTEAAAILDSKEIALEEARVALAYARSEREADRALIDERDLLVRELALARAEIAARRDVRSAACPTAVDEGPSTLVMYPFKTE
jgi:hypothetical protein